MKNNSLHARDFDNSQPTFHGYVIIKWMFLNKNWREEKTAIFDDSQKNSKTKHSHNNSKNVPFRGGF